MFIRKFTEAKEDEKNETDQEDHVAAPISCFYPGDSLPCLRANEENVFSVWTRSVMNWAFSMYTRKHQTQHTNNPTVSFPCLVFLPGYKLDLSDNFPNPTPLDRTSSYLCESISINSPMACGISGNNSIYLTSFTPMAFSFCCPKFFGSYCPGCCRQFCRPCRSYACKPCVSWGCCQSVCFGSCGPFGPCGPYGRCGRFEGPLINIQISPVPVTGLPCPNICAPK